MNQKAIFGLLLAGVVFSSGCLGSSSSDCGSPCHDVPPSSGAHLSHTDRLLPMPCDTCHGEGASDAVHPGHDDGGLTVLAQEGYEAVHGTRPSWYGSTWGDGAAFHGMDPSSSVCSGLACHGLETVGWTQDLKSAVYNSVCKGCHDLTPAEFRLPGDPVLRRASNAAANYEGPVSGFSRGGHGDAAINDPGWFRDSAPGSSVPLACVACHDPEAEHFPVADQNPYRMPSAVLDNTLPGAEAIETRISNLCTQTNCHPKFLRTGHFAFLEPPKHPNDHWDLYLYDPVLQVWYLNPDPRRITTFGIISEPINLEAVSFTTDPAYDPMGRANPVGLHIDRYVDHWGYWNTSAPATADSLDDEPFMPLGDPLLKRVGDVFDNNLADGTASLVVCTTCHNPHGTDLYVQGQVPGQWSTLQAVPANGMLRLRDQNDELCDACH